MDIPFSEVKDVLIQRLPYKIMWMDEMGGIIYGNEQFCKRLGYKASEITRLSVYDINPSTTKESWEKHWKEVKKKGGVNFKSVHQTKEGKYYNVEVFSQFFSNNGKEIIYAIVNDITESSFYRNLLNSSERINQIGGWKLNLQDGSLIVTEQALCILDTENKEDLLPGNVIHLFKEPDTIKKLLSEVLRNGSGYDEILELKNGRHVRCVTEAESKRNKIYKIIGTYQDVTESYKRANRLQLFKEIIDNAEDLIYLYNRDGKLLHYSNSVSRELGFTKKQLDGFTIYDLDGRIDTYWWHNHFDEIKAKGSLTLDWEITRKDGTVFPASIVANHLVYEGNDINCAVIRNVTSIKEKENQLQEALDELSELKDELEIDNQNLRQEISDTLNFENIICQSDAYRQVLEQVTQVAVTDATVLITGESGTGKELLASAVHLNSTRKDNVLIKVNCATLPKELIESELFGHKKGAFTGATADKQGKFSLADGGTIFLDEIGEVPIDLQAKLLRVLQEGEFDPLGATATTKVDVRVIAATNRDLQEMVKKGTFREDLYYRLNVFPIENIPLRARKEDIPLLAQFFLEKYSAKAGKDFKRLSKKTIAKLMDYSFPGNIRELENLIERAVIIENGTTLQPGSWLPTENGKIDSEEFKPIDVMQRDYIIKVLEHTNWRVSGPRGAATILGMKDKTLFARMKKLGIEKQTSLKK
ncbi:MULTISPECIES: sigma 54-interacting transcriptional regulator [Flavobacteriaceae]|uniref:sigma 54-interacting transcriptional regulator n=1 Tax=Flavobacteriaceae TaxID=49546 RepID=UPI001492A53F|nr:MULTISPECIES: sigma 54-interacting transcriptional regulator [Allomuricauda]MDC6366200.1 sigma 54-interacting transcriptional regulator [Muricauda sp. AC10]